MAGEAVAVAVAAAKAVGALTATKALKPATHRIKPRRNTLLRWWVNGSRPGDL